MKRLLSLLLMVGLLALAPALSQAQNLLTNGDLNSATQVGDPNLYYPSPLPWTLTTEPCSFEPCSIVRYPAFQADYADRTASGGLGLVFSASEGNFPGFPDVLTVDADLSQTVPGTPGQEYKMTGWAYFEGGYAGGVDILDPSSPDGARASLTDTFFALEFLDGLGAVLLGSVEIELKAAGQVNNPDITEATRNWMQHTLIGVAPPETVSVRVRVSMVDGEFNIDLPHQSAWVDDFSLTAIPEPSTCVLGLLSLGLIGLVRRTRWSLRQCSTT